MDDTENPNTQAEDVTFWIVWSPESDKPPQFKFSKRSQADIVASNMFAKYPGQTWHIMECVTTLKNEIVLVKDERD